MSFAVDIFGPRHCIHSRLAILSLLLVVLPPLALGSRGRGVSRLVRDGQPPRLPLFRWNAVHCVYAKVRVFDERKLRRPTSSRTRPAAACESRIATRGPRLIIATRLYNLPLCFHFFSAACSGAREGNGEEGAGGHARRAGRRTATAGRTGQDGRLEQTKGLPRGPLSQPRGGGASRGHPTCKVLRGVLPRELEAVHVREGPLGARQRAHPLLCRL